MKSLALAIALAASADAGDAQVFDPLRQHSFATNLHDDWHSFRYITQVRIPDTPEAIKNAELFDRHGRQVLFRMLADEVTGLIIGTVEDDLEIELIRRRETEEGLQFVLAGNADGHAVQLDGSNLVVTDLKRRDYCVSLESLVSSDLPITVSVAVDVSGSMADAIEDVQQSFINFMAQLPSGAVCRVVVFNDQARFLIPIPDLATASETQTFPCQSFAEIAAETTFIAGGGTDIVAALTPLYARAVAETETQTLVAVISDGVGSVAKWSAPFRELAALNNSAVAASGTYTVVNWLGDYRTDYPLSTLADTSIFGRIESQPVAEEFFKRTNSILHSQSLLKPFECLAQTP